MNDRVAFRVAFKVRSLILLSGIVASASMAQTVSPPVVDYNNAVESSFEVANTTLRTLYITLEPKSFSLDRAGRASFRPLDATTQVELSQHSLRLPPQQKRTIYYKASALRYPAWFTIYANFAGSPVRDKVNVQIELPHTVYLLPKKGAVKGDIILREMQVKDDHLLGIAENRGDSVARMQSLMAVTTQGKRLEGGGFPLLPHGIRDFDIALHGASVVRVVGKLEKFEVNEPLRPRESLALSEK